MTKNKHAPNNEPKTLLNKVKLKNRENKPTSRTLPQVNNAILWNPIIKSVAIKLNINAGIYLEPSSAGT